MDIEVSQVLLMQLSSLYLVNCGIRARRGPFTSYILNILLKNGDIKIKANVIS